jgi:hypothetical protein
MFILEIDQKYAFWYLVHLDFHNLLLVPRLDSQRQQCVGGMANIVQATISPFS